MANTLTYLPFYLKIFWNGNRQGGVVVKMAKLKLNNADIKTKKYRDKDDIIVWMMMLPSLFLLVVVSIYPFLWLMKYVFYNYNGFKAYYTGFRNFERLFHDEIFWSSVGQTFHYAFLKIVLVIPIALTLAVILNGKIKGKNIFRISYFIPTVISSAVYSLIWYFIYNPYNGVLNSMLSAISITTQKIDWLGNPKIAMISIAVVAVWGGFGNYMILFLSGLQSIPASIYESSKIDGCNSVQDFFYITIPMMGPILKVIMMLAITTALKDYESIMVLTGGGPVGKTNVMFLYVYNLMFGNENSGASLQVGYGAVVGLMSAFIIGLVTVAYLKLSKKLDDIY